MAGHRNLVILKKLNNRNINQLLVPNDHEMNLTNFPINAVFNHWWNRLISAILELNFDKITCWLRDNFDQKSYVKQP